MAAESKLGALQIHPKVSIPIFAGAFASILVGIAKQQGLDLSGYESNIVVIIMGVVGYFVPSA